MKGFKAAIRFSMISVQNTLQRVEICIFFVVVFLTLSFCLPGAASFLWQTGGCVNVWEMYIWFMLSRITHMYYIFFAIFLAGQIIRFRSETAYYLIRADRKTWVFSQILSLFVTLLLFQIFLLLCFAILCGGRVTFSGTWYAADKATWSRYKAMVASSEVMSASNAWVKYNPHLIGGQTCLLSMLIGMFTGMLLLLFYLKRQTAYGVACLVFLWWMDYRIQIFVAGEMAFESFGGLALLSYISPFGMSRLNNLYPYFGRISFSYAVAFLTGTILLLFLLILNASEELDFVKLE